MTQHRARIRPFITCLVLGTLGLATSCGTEAEVDDGAEHEQSQVVTLTGGALLVVGNATLGPGDAALRQRLQTLGLTITVKTGAAVTAADATSKLVVISESVLSADVNTKLRNVSAPVVSLEPL